MLSRTLIVCGLLVLCLGGYSSSSPTVQTGPSLVSTHRATFDRYCLTCHNEKAKAQGAVPIALNSLDMARIGANADVWEKIVLKMRAGVMPPASASRPSKAVRDGFLTWLEGELDRAAAAAPNPGRKDSLHRLNRTEYRNAIR